MELSTNDGSQLWMFVFFNQAPALFTPILCSLKQGLFAHAQKPIERLLQIAIITELAGAYPGPSPAIIKHQRPSENGPTENLGQVYRRDE